MPDEDMRRREFLGKTVVGVGGAAAIGVGGCAGLSNPAMGGLDHDDLNALLERLDSLLERAPRTFITGFLRREGDVSVVQDDEALRLSDGLARRAIRALTLTGMVLELPEGLRESPDVQRRVDALEEELDETFVDFSQMLSMSPREDLLDIDEELRLDPDMVMRLCEELDRYGARDGLDRGARRRLRAVGRRVTNRIRGRSFSEVAADCVDTFEVLVAAAGETLPLAEWPVSPEIAMLLHLHSPGVSVSKEEGQTSEPQPWTRREQTEFLDELYQESTEQGDENSAVAALTEEAPRPRRRRRGRRAGAALLGVGLGLTAVGAGVTPLWYAGYVAGGVSITIGTILLVVGAILLARSNRRRR